MGGLLRFLLLATALWLIISGVRHLFFLSSLSLRKKEEAKKQKELPLVQDLQCGRFVLERDAICVSFRGQGLYFCSQECRDLYIRAQITGE
jgi:YHS domain-containing protein